MWVSTEAARKAANGTHVAIRIDNLRRDEGSDEKLRVDLMVNSPKMVGMVALPSDISVGITPDQGKRIRYEATAVAEMTDSVSPRLHAILDGMPEGITQIHELSGVGSIGDPLHGDLMAGSTKSPLYGAAYEKRGLVKGIALMSHAPTQPRVEHVCGLSKGSVTNIAQSMAHFNSQEIAAIDAKIADGIDEDELAACGESVSDWIKPAARFQNFQATSAAAEAKKTEESKADDSQFDRMMAAMAAQNAQQDKNLTQIREAQTQSQQAQTQLVQMMAMMSAGQEQQRLTNTWVVQSMKAISESAGCAIEAPPASQEIATPPPALDRMAQTAGGGARERTSSETEGDALRVEEQLLDSTPPPQDF